MLRAADPWLLVSGSLAIAAGTLGIGPATAAPSSVLELDANIRSDGGLDWGAGGGSPGTGGAFGGGVFVGPATTPAPPAATAALTGVPGHVAGVFAVDPLSGDGGPCASGGGGGDPTVFTGAGGEKNGDRIDTMTFGTGSVPNKDELSNVYAVAHSPAAGTAEVFFGAERVVTDGDSHVDFEFLHDAVTRSAGCAGGFSGNRSQGDLLLAIDYANGGALGGVSVHRWHCAAEPGPQPADGTPCNPPAHGPSVPHYQDVTSVIPPPAAVVLTNGSAPVACGGWACRAADGTQIANLPPNAFVEGGLDLTATGFSGCGATLLAHTRVAQSFGSALKDFVGPLALNLCPPPPVTTTTTSTTLAPTTTTSTTVAPTTTTSTSAPAAVPTTVVTGPIGISAITIERPPGNPAPQVLGVVLTDGDDELPRTGAATRGLLVWAGLALLTGGVLVRASRPRGGLAPPR